MKRLIILLIFCMVFLCGCTDDIEELGGYKLDKCIYVNGYHYHIVCIDGVQYLQHFHGSLTPYLKEDGTIRFCGEK